MHVLQFFLTRTNRRLCNLVNFLLQQSHVWGRWQVLPTDFFSQRRFWSFAVIYQFTTRKSPSLKFMQTTAMHTVSRQILTFALLALIAIISTPLKQPLFWRLKQQPQQQNGKQREKLTITFISVRTVYHPVPMNCFAVIQTGRLRRQVGDVMIRNFTACTSTNPLNKVKTCMKSPWSATCRMKSGSCYYYVTCEKRRSVLSWFCKEVHLSYTVPACCDFVCP